MFSDFILVKHERTTISSWRVHQKGEVGTATFSGDFALFLWNDSFRSTEYLVLHGGIKRFGQVGDRFGSGHARLFIHGEFLFHLQVDHCENE